MKTFGNIQDIQAAFGDSLKIDGETITVDTSAIKPETWADMAYTSTFGNDAVKDLARKIIFATGGSLGIQRKSVHNLYMAVGRGEITGFSMPAINLRAITFNMALAAFSAAKKLNAGAIIMEIARSEIGYTDQPPMEYAANVVAAAIAAGWNRPVFLQGDHFQANRKKYFADPDKEVAAIKDIVARAMDAGFYNIDVDSSTLVDISKSDLRDQQELNSRVCADITRFIRERSPKNITVSVGGEIGEIGGTNSNEADMEAFMSGFLEYADGAETISKMAVQTGTAHGGVVLPDGSIASVKLDFDVLDRLGRMAREKYHIGGVVQHGASTLPEDMFYHFPKMNTLEVHLATQFQNMVYDLMPDDLKNQIYAWLEAEKKDEWKEGLTREQFLYKTRKRAIGAFKKQIWDMPEQVIDEITQALETKFTHLFRLLGMENTIEKITPYL